MERITNFGLIVYSTNVMEEVLGEASETVNALLAVTDDIGHQWFKDTVTPVWWSDMWLSEAMVFHLKETIVMSIAVTDETFRMWNDWNAHTVVATFSVECCPSDMEYFKPISSVHETCGSDFNHTTPVWKNITAESPISDMIAFTDYEKAKAVTAIHLAMDIAKNVFILDIVKMYLKKYAYKTVSGKEFWTFIKEISFPKAKLWLNPEEMLSWSNQSGLPIISVSRLYHLNKAMIVQQSCRENNRDLWHIPIAYRRQGDDDQSPPVTKWLSGTKPITVDTPQSDEWIMINPDAAYVIVNYDYNNWLLLANDMYRETRFTEGQRFKLLADANNLLSLKYPNMAGVLLELSMCFRSANNFHLFVEPNHFFLLKAMQLMKTSPKLGAWKEYIKYVLGNIYDNERSSNKSKRATFREAGQNQMFLWLCKYNYTNCVKDAMEEFERWKDKPTDPHFPTRATYEEEQQIFLCTAVCMDSNSENFLFKRNSYKFTSAEIISLCGSNAILIDRVLETYTQPTNVSFFDEAAKTLADNEKHWPKLFAFLDKNFMTLYRYNSNDFSRILDFVEYIRYSPKQFHRMDRVLEKNMKMMNPEHTLLIKRQLYEYRRDLPYYENVIKTIESWLEKESWKNKEGKL